MPLTVLQVLPSLESGGVERGTLEVGAELVRRGHRSLVVSGGGRMVGPLEQAGSQHFEVAVGNKSPLTLRWVGWLKRLMQEQRVDIVHVRSRVPGWVTWLAWNSLPEQQRPRLVTTVHGQYSVNRYSEVMTRGEVVIAVSSTIRDYILANYPAVPEERIRLIHRGVDPAEFPRDYEPSADWLRQFHEQFPQTRGRRLLTLPGRITRLKGHDHFLQLLRDLKSRGQSVHGLIVGGEDRGKARYGRELRKLVKSLSLDDDVTFTGLRSDMKEIYAISDLVLSLSSKPESFGRTVLEALSLGTPVLGYAHGGVGEILRTVFTDGLVKSGDSTELSARAEKVLAANTAVPPFDAFRLEDMLDQTIELYEGLAGMTAVRRVA
jgi:glycosyltransferase involved in cell wall biosynthesis